MIKYIEIYNKIQKEDFLKKENKKDKKERKLSFSKSKKSNIKINDKEEIYEVDDLINNKQYQQLQFNLKATATEKDKMIRSDSNEVDIRTKGTRVLLTKNGNLSAAKFKFSRRKKDKGKETIKLTFDLFQNDLENCNLELSKKKYILKSKTYRKHLEKH